MQAPTGYHGVITRYQEARGHAKQSDKLPSLAISHARIGAIRVGGTMTANDKLRHHAWDAKHQHTADINQDEHGATILARHIRETPNVTKPDGTTRRGKYHSNLTAKTGSLF